MLLKRASEHDDIVQVDQARLPCEADQDEVHEPLKQNRRVGKAEAQHFELVSTSSGDESSLIAVDGSNLSLPISSAQI